MSKILMHWLTPVIATITLTACGGGSNPSNVVAQGAPSNSASLRWIPPSERADGSPIGELSGYRILYGQLSGIYNHKVTINNPGITSSLIKDLGPGSWYFALVAITSDGLVSAPSAEASKRF